MSTIIDTLITDRTQADVDHVVELKNKILTKGLAALTAEEKTEYMAGMRGAYNATDMNRVGLAQKFISDQATASGLDLPSNAKTDWTMTDIPTQSQISSYLNEIRTMRNNLPVLSDTPNVPQDMDNLTFETANNIEKIVVACYEALAWCIPSFEYSGITYCG